MQSENEVELDSNRPPIRVGIVGLGRAAFFNHIPIFQKLPNLFQITAACDTDKSRRDRLVETYGGKGIKMYRQLEDMLDDPDIDLVDIALPSTFHVEAALASLQRDKWTLLETPLALSHDDAVVLKGASVKARNKLFVNVSKMFSPDFMLAKQVIESPELGEIYEVRIRKQDFIRRDDWQTVKRCGGGIAFTEGTETLLQAQALLRTPPVQLWSELKRLASLGDAEDYAHIILKTRLNITADIEINGGQVPPFEPAFTIRGMRGECKIPAGSSEGMFRIIDPEYKFPRRRSSVRTPEITDLHEDFPIVDVPVKLNDSVETGDLCFWKALYRTIRVAAPFPFQLEEIVETIRYLQLIKQASPFAK